MTSGVGVEMLSSQSEVKKSVGKVNATFKVKYHLAKAITYMF
jgi:hypothetical protein